jgi:hypothetical protein
MPIPLQLREKMSEDPYYKNCARKNSDCSGRITWEHAFIYKNQIQERWAIIPLCVYHHLGNGLNKELNHYLALKRADIEDLCKRMPKKDWKQYWNYLKNKYER